MVKDRFEIIMIKDKKIAAFHEKGPPVFPSGIVVKTFKGIVYDYVCTKKDMYATTNLQLFD